MLVIIDAVNVMAAYQPVMQGCGSHCERKAVIIVTNFIRVH